MPKGRSMREEAQYGLRASGVGEASHPGPPSAPSQQSVPEDVLDAMQYDLTRDDSDSNVLSCGSPPRSLGHSQPGLHVSHEVAHLLVSEHRSRRTRRRVRRVLNDSDSDAPLVQPVSPPDKARSRGQRRVVLVPQDSEGTPESIQDREPPTQVSSAAVSTLPASSEQFEGWCWSILLNQCPVHR